MLKKVFAVSAICAMFCGISFGKTNALDLVEYELSIDGNGLEHSCSGNENYAKCRFKDIDMAFMSIKNTNLEIQLTDYQYKENISGEIVSGLGQDLNKFIPNKFECSLNSKLNVDDLDNYGVLECKLYSDVAMLKFYIDSKTHSKAYRYKTMPTIMTNNIAMMEKIIKSFKDRETKYYEKLEKLRSDRNTKIDDIQDEIDFIRMSLRTKENNSKCGCGACNRHKKELEKSYSRKSYEMSQIRTEYGNAYDAIQREYEEGVQEDIDSLVAFLKQYDHEIKEIKIHVKANSLADTLLNLSAKRFFSFNENIPLNKEQKLEREEEKKRIMAKYYSQLESSRAAAITLVKESPYLSNQLKKTLSEVVKQQAKLFDPNSNTRNMKILITSINNKPINLGDELNKLRVAYLNDYANDDENNMFKALFDIINQYDIRLVREWPQD